MAASKEAQLHTNISTLLREERSRDIEAVRISCETKVSSILSKIKPWNPFAKGKNGRDLCTELLVPKHLTSVWQRGELRALK